jgi:hypothetical protein
MNHDLKSPGIFSQVECSHCQTAGAIVASAPEQICPSLAADATEGETVSGLF